MFLMPGLIMVKPRSDNQNKFHGNIGMSINRYGHLLKYGLIYWRWSKKPRGCFGRLWNEELK